MSGRGDRGRGRGRGGGGAFGGFGDRGRGGGGRGGGGRGGGGDIQIFYPENASEPIPDAQVTRTEDQLVGGKSAGTPNVGGLLLTDAGYPHRPGYGTQGVKIVLRTNYFELVPASDLVLYRYHAGVQPTAAGRPPVGKKLKRVIALLLEADLFAGIRDQVATDHASTIISRVRLPGTELPDDRVEVSIPYRVEDEDEPRERAANYRVQVTQTGTITVSELVDFLRSTNANAVYNGKEQAIQALNIIMARSPSTNPNIVCPGRNRFFPIGPDATRADLSGVLQAIRGYYTSVRAATGRILVNVNVSHDVFLKPDGLDRVIEEFGRENSHNRYHLQRFLKGVRVEVTHLPARRSRNGQPIRRIKTIFGLANTNDGQGRENPPRVARFGAGANDVQFFHGTLPGQNPSTTPGAQGPPNEYVSVFRFFQREYNRAIRNPGLPLVNVGNRENPVYLPAEVCKVVDGQVSDSTLNPVSTDRMMRFAARKPPENARSIVGEGSRVVGLLPPASLSLGPFGVAVRPEMITVPARVLSGPAVTYRGNKTANTRFGSWNMVDIKFTTGANIGAWSYLWLHGENENVPFGGQRGLPAVDVFHRALGVNGITAPLPIQPGLGCVLTSDIAINDANISAAFDKIRKHPKQPKFMLVILATTDAAVYNRVKYVGDVKTGIHTVCVVRTKFMEQKGQDRYFANVALKFNLKGGGINQALERNKLGIISDGKTMVVGIDVTHPSPNSQRSAPSVAGIVATIDQTLGQWPADLRIQERREEMVSDLKGLLKGRLQLWKAKNKSFPENLLIYRDGVSEGQYQLVLNKELPQLREACAETYPANSTKAGLPKISIIVVGKRHHTRFYPTKEGDADRSSNPKNGTIVDRGVTEARNWDFFLQAHTGLQGTARPAHYFVVLDEIFAKRPAPPGQTPADSLEQLSHNMCYLFGRATKAVSICPPAYYADLVCERARCYLHGIFNPGTPSQSVASGQPQQLAAEADVRIHDKLKDTMFYI